MKILYVGDGRCRKNWGAQATSQALYDIIALEHSITAIIPSSYKLVESVPVLYNSAYPIQLLFEKEINFLLTLLWKIGKRIYKNDYITEDIEASIEKFLKLKNKYPRLNQIYKSVMECDGVVLNGEGTIIFSTPPHRVALFFLFMLRLAQKMGKKTYFLNGMISYSPSSKEDARFIRQMVNIFQDCTAISLRDNLSVKILSEISTRLNSRFIPDALFTGRDDFKEVKHKYSKGIFYPDIPLNRYSEEYDFNRDYICVSGGSAVAKQANDNMAVKSFVELINKLKKIGIRIYLVPTCSGDKFLYKVARITGVPLIPLETNVKQGGSILANARVFVSGRFHPSVFASLGNTPCIFMKSNSHKTLSIQEVLDYEDVQFEYSAIPDKAEIEQICKKVVSYLKEGSSLRDKISKTVENLADKAREETLKILRD